MTSHTPEIEHILSSFEISTETLVSLSKEYNRQMDAALNRQKSSFKMIPTHAKLPKGSETGYFGVVDWGGSNLTISIYHLEGGGKLEIVGEVIRHEWTLSEIKNPLNAIHLVATFLKQIMGFQPAPIQDIGMTFAFPVDQKGLAEAVPVEMSKGWSINGIEGKNIVQVINQALADQGLTNVKISSLTNDTLDPLMVETYRARAKDPQSAPVSIGGVVGTGVNFVLEENGVLYNTEAGFFDGVRNIRNEIDLTLDASFPADPDPGVHLYEKMVSGKFIGELFRLSVLSLAAKTPLFSWCQNNPHFQNQLGLDSRYLAAMCQAEHGGDGAPDYIHVQHVLDDLGVKTSEVEEREVLAKLSAVIGRRSAQLFGMAVAAMVLRSKKEAPEPTKVAIIGSVFNKYPNYEDMARATIRDIFGIIFSGGGQSEPKIQFIPVTDAGGGAAIIAAVAKSSPT